MGPSLSFIRKLTVHHSVNLLRNFYDDGLVDHRSVLGWLAQQLGACNLAQAGFLARLADEYLEDITSCRALAHPFVEACLNKLAEVAICPSLCVFIVLTPAQVRANVISELSFLDNMLAELLRVSSSIPMRGWLD